MKCDLCGLDSGDRARHHTNECFILQRQIATECWPLAQALRIITDAMDPSEAPQAVIKNNAELIGRIRKIVS